MQIRALNAIFQSATDSHRFIIWLADHFPSPMNPETQMRQNKIALIVTYNKYVAYKARAAEIAHINKQKIEKYIEEDKRQKKNQYQQLLDHLSFELRKKEAEKIERMLKRIEIFRSRCQCFIEEYTQKTDALYANHVYTGVAEKTHQFKNDKNNLVACKIFMRELFCYVKSKILQLDEYQQSRLEKALHTSNPVEAIQQLELEYTKAFLRNKVLIPAIQAQHGMIANVEGLAEQMLDHSESIVQALQQVISSVLNPLVRATLSQVVAMIDQRNCLDDAKKHANHLKSNMEDFMINEQSTSHAEAVVMLSTIINTVEEAQASIMSEIVESEKYFV